MNFKEYQARALLTESKPTELNFGEVGLHLLLDMSITMGEVMNIAKRTIFYGKEFDAEKVRKLASDLNGYSVLIAELSDYIHRKNDRSQYNALPVEAQNVAPENVDLRLLHAAIGIFTESTEALELVRDQLRGNKFDAVGWGEEIGGDISWYAAIGHDAAGTDEDVEREKNIRKLELRNKGKTFNADATINRDTAAERQILEGKA